MRICETVTAHVLRNSSAMHVDDDEVGSDGNVKTVKVSTALTALQENIMSIWRPVFANARMQCTCHVNVVRFRDLLAC